MAQSARADSTSANPKQRNRFAGRDGRADALADVAAGARFKLYAHVFNGFKPGFAVPGIDCEPHDTGTIVFELVPELAVQEGTPPSDGFSPEIAEYARTYNATILAEKHAEVAAVCPHAQRASEPSN